MYCIYFKEQLKLKQIITPTLSECILCEILMGNKIGYIAITYCSPTVIVVCGGMILTFLFLG